MAKPRDIQWAPLLALPDRPHLPLQARLRLAIVQVILDGKLVPGAALPSSRDLAKALGISRNTVTSAYQQLTDEHYLASRPRSGISVLAHHRPAPIQPPSAPADPVGPPPNWSTRVQRSQRDRPTLSKPHRWSDYP